MRRLGALLVAAFGVALSLSVVAASHASAHVLITDTAQSYGAIVHIIPDDDPIAGQSATLFFDVQDEFLKDTSKVTVTVQNTSSRTPGLASSPLPADSINGVAILDYTFPAQGVYLLTFTVQTDGRTYTFQHSQRVARGTVAGAMQQPRHQWAEALLIFSGLGLVLLIVVAFNHRHAITRQSTF